jgi:hypothetical protein
MKIGDKVKLCTVDYQLDAFISGEHEDGRSIGYWLVDCPDKAMKDVVFCKEPINGKYYNFGNTESWIIPADNSLEQVIQLVDNWMNDDSGYDEQVYPQIEAGLTANDQRGNYTR